MKTLIFGLCLFASIPTFAYTDYNCDVRGYRVELTLTQDTSTSMRLIDRYRYQTLAIGYAGSLEKRGITTVYHFYPQIGPFELTFRTQDTIDLPKKLEGWIQSKDMYFPLFDRMDCTRLN